MWVDWWREKRLERKAARRVLTDILSSLKRVVANLNAGSITSK